MRNRKEGKKILSILLSAMLCLNVPVAALAESEDVIVAAETTEENWGDASENEETGYEEETASEEDTQDAADQDEDIIGAEEEQEPALEEGDEQLLDEPEQEEEPEQYADETAEQTVDVSGFPTEIPAGETYTLTGDITLAEGQQITNLAGTLDGHGYTITLSGTSLAANVSGTIQNLGVKGTVQVSTDHKGTMADTLTGTIRNSYSIVNIDDGGSWSEVGGLVGTLTGGTIQNCYFAGGGSALMMYGIASYNNSAASQVSNSYYVASMGAFGMVSPAPQQTNCVKKTAAEMKSEAVVALLNTSIVNTGYVFAYEDGSYPVLKAGVAEANWAVLDSALEQAGGLQKEAYTADTWKTLEDAVTEGNALKEQTGASQEEINCAADKITKAIADLRRETIVKPVAIPETATPIASQSDFSKMSNAKGKYFVLTQDITIDSNYMDASDYMNFEAFAGVLDGKGHTITFDHADAVFASLAAGAVVQNVSVTGTMSSSEVTGPFGKTAYGASILNCRSNISGSNVAGFIGKTGAYMGATASQDCTGVIANCIAIGDNGKGALCNSSSNNSGAAVIQNCYWVDTLGGGAGAMPEDDMKTLNLVEKLNTDKGANGTSWGQGSDGYPYFGENRSYTPGSFEWPETGENKYPIAFQAYNGAEAVALEDGRLEVSPDAVGMAHVAGTFSLQGYTAPEGSSFSWGFSQRKPESAFDIYEDGTFCVNGTGVAVLTATQNNSDGSSETLASVAIRSSRQQMTDIRLYIDGEDVTGGNFTVQGSENKKIVVKAQYQGNDTYQDVSYASFTYTADEKGQALLHNRVNTSSSFSFKEAGSAVFTVTAKNQPEISRTVTVTSQYVPVESVVPAISGTQVIHTRNANSNGQESDGRVAFNPILGSVVVTPANATNADKVTITSDDPEGVIAYYTSGEKGYVPKQAGTVTFTATIEDTDPNTKETRTVSGDSTVTFVYKNNVTAIELPEENRNITVAAGETSEKFKPTVKGELDEQGYEVTEPALTWTYSKNHVARIVRTGSGYWKKGEGVNVSDPDYGSYFTAAEYQVIGVSEGTVTATGTPIDNKNQVEPVTITITVTKGSGQDPDVLGNAQEGISGALDYIENSHRDSGYVYGNEWLIYAMLQENREISPSALEAYYQSVAAEVRQWNADQKPTDIERTALALARMERDITNVDGVNLAAMIYNSDKLKNGSNELIYALLALDAANVTIPSDAKWSRSTIIAELLKFQNANGGFGLTGKRSPGVDITAMALQALAPYQSRPEVKTAVAKAVTYLQKEMRDDFGYGSAESAAQVLLALTCLGINPTSPDAGFGTPDFNLISNLMTYRQSDGGFAHLTNDGRSQEMSTVQVLEALSAYRGGTNTYWSVNGEYQTVLVTILGDELHNSDKDGIIHSLGNGTLQTWAAKAEYRVKKTATAVDAIDLVLAASGMTCVKKYNGTYIASVTNASGVTIGEFTNGEGSGWLYSVNGVNPDVAVSSYKLADNDNLIFYYTDNYKLEPGMNPDECEHDWDDGEITRAATCTQAGVLTYTCSICGEERNVTIPAKGHSFDNGRITRMANCTASGVRTYTCRVCKKTKTESIPAKGHKFGSWTKISDATVFAPKKEQRRCTVCKKSETRNSGSRLKPTITVNTNTVVLKTKQKTSAFKVSGLARGDSVKSWKSSNTSVFTVTNKGVITAGKKSGKSATLTITLASGLKKNVTVKVQKGAVAATGITGLRSAVTMKKGKTLTLKPSALPITCQQKFSYSTSNKNVATVSSKGVITAKKPGTAKITVKCGKKKFTVTVTVTK